MKGSEESRNALKKMTRMTSIVLVIVVAYVGWIFFSRWQENRRVERERAKRQAREAQMVVDTYGGDRLKILSFYASVPQIKRGESAQLCYGVSNAKSVRIEPAVQGVWPSISRCVDVAPAKDTTYTLFAEGKDGRSDQQTATVTVK